MKHQSLSSGKINSKACFRGKIRKKIFSLSSAEFAQRVVKVNLHLSPFLRRASKVIKFISKTYFLRSGSARSFK